MKVLAIARNTFKECVRDKVLYNLVIFAILIITSSLILGTITIGDVKQIIINLGLSTLTIFGTLISIFIGIQLVYKEIDKRQFTVFFPNQSRATSLFGKVSRADVDSGSERVDHDLGHLRITCTCDTRFRPQTFTSC